LVRSHLRSIGGIILQHQRERLFTKNETNLKKERERDE